MDVPIKHPKKRNSDKYTQTDYSIAYDFSKRIWKEMGQLLRGIILFGSAAKKVPSTGDVDILLILDDVAIQLTPELIQTYRIIVQKAVVDTNKKLHITTLRFSNFWEYVRSGDPIAVNILRDGIAIVDTGFFDPLQLLLHQGRIRPSPESIYTYFNRAPQTLQNAKYHVMQAVLDLYWAVIDAAHAALMKMNEIPPSPHHVADLLEERMVKQGLLDKRYPAIMREFYSIGKMITHGEITSITGDQFDLYLKEAEDFVRTMQEFIEGPK